MILRVLVDPESKTAWLAKEFRNERPVGRACARFLAESRATDQIRPGPPGRQVAAVAIPNPDRAVVDPTKLREYLLSSSHPVGRFKSGFFVSLGYEAARWERLETDLCVASTSRKRRWSSTRAPTGGSS